jgi:hypothetical protein
MERFRALDMDDRIIVLSDHIKARCVKCSGDRSKKVIFLDHIDILDKAWLSTSTLNPMSSHPCGRPLRHQSLEKLK